MRHFIFVSYVKMLARLHFAIERGRILKGEKFNEVDEIKLNVTEKLSTISKDAFKKLSQRPLIGKAYEIFAEKHEQ